MRSSRSNGILLILCFIIFLGWYNRYQSMKRVKHNAETEHSSTNLLLPSPFTKNKALQAKTVADVTKPLGGGGRSVVREGEVRANFNTTMNQGKERHSSKQPKDGLARLEAEFQKHEAKVRAVKAAGKVMESDPEALMAISKLQAAARKVLVAKYGAEPYMIEVKLAFPESMPDYATAGKDGTMLFLMAPAAHVPYGVTYFMELVDGWKSGSFHRMAGHVLQAQASVKSGRLPGLAYQECVSPLPAPSNSLFFL